MTSSVSPQLKQIANTQRSMVRRQDDSTLDQTYSSYFCIIYIDESLNAYIKAYLNITFREILMLIIFIHSAFYHHNDFACFKASEVIQNFQVCCCKCWHSNGRRHTGVVIPMLLPRRHRNIHYTAFLSATIQ